MLDFRHANLNRNVTDRLLHIFQEAYRELRPRAPMPEIEVEFFAYVNINNTIRLRDGKLFVRLSDLLEGAPEAVLRAIAHILLPKCTASLSSAPKRLVIADTFQVTTSRAKLILCVRCEAASESKARKGGPTIWTNLRRAEP